MGELRAKHDPSAAVGVPAHITLLYPFRSPDLIDASLIDRLRALFARQRAFAFALASVERWPGIVYLAPHPAEPFSFAIELLASTFPDTPPYGGAFDVVVPHLTVADGVSDQTGDEIAAHLTPQLPIHAQASAAQLLEQERDGRWHTRAVLPLA